ncbi:hypothetical protein [Agromyces larvae]|uniref:Bacitracin resistance protein n=1 Tax=Agromyces larvae TaxID=2929802 RepID=A0ABY4C1T5_9MICO|nr:hypothetical protein [Agromyces larvae]UOE45440.1 hypothetical protein MTO99_06695 [Agromyces larvae]
MSATTGDGGASELVPETQPTARRELPLWLRATLAAFFGLFFAYDLWEVLESLLQLLALGLGFTPGGWAIMVAALIAPPALFAIAFVLGRRRGILIVVACYLAGLGVSGALFASLSVLLGAVGGVVVP